MDPDGGTYALLDAGDGRRLERFGAITLDRPAPAMAGIARRDPAAWSSAAARYVRSPEAGASTRGGSETMDEASSTLAAATGGAWIPPGAVPERWTMALEGIALELRPTPAGQVGVFPEHAVVAGWAAERAADVARINDHPATVLNLFAYTGLVTLALARAGARVAHVDASRPAVAWARRNAALAGLDDRPVRWLVDDAAAFVAREARRGRRYDGVILDPPTYGHGPDGGAWRLADGLAPLLAGVDRLLADGPWFLACTAHATGVDASGLLATAIAGLGRPVGCGRGPRPRPAGVERGEDGGRGGHPPLRDAGDRMMPMGTDAITSAANPRIRAALALRERRNRDRTGHVLIDGVREVGRALDAGLVVVEAFVAIGGSRDEARAAILEQAGGRRRRAGASRRRSPDQAGLRRAGQRHRGRGGRPAD